MNETAGITLRHGKSLAGLLALAGLYFLVASGFTLVFGLLPNINLAHGSLYLLGAYIGYSTANATGFFPYTPSTHLVQGLKVALDMLEAEGLEAVFARHERAAEATRRCVRHWGLEIVSRTPAEHSPSLTAVMVPDGHSADRLRKIILERSNMSLGNGLGRLADTVFRIGHLGDFHDLMVMGTLSGVEMGLAAADIPHRSGGVTAAMQHLQGNA